MLVLYKDGISTAQAFDSQYFAHLQTWQNVIQEDGLWDLIHDKGNKEGGNANGMNQEWKGTNKNFSIKFILIRSMQSKFYSKTTMQRRFFDVIFNHFILFG